jgi:hypothetical protein
VLTAKDGTQEVVTGQAPASGSAPRRSYFFRRGAQLLRVEQPEVARHVSVCGCQTKRRGGVGGARARSLVVAWPVPKGLTFAGTLKVSVPHVVVLFDFNPDCPRLPPPP